MKIPTPLHGHFINNLRFSLTYLVKKRVEKTCIFCKRVFLVVPSSAKRRKCCSKACYYSTIKGVKFPWLTPFKKGSRPWNDGKKVLESIKCNMCGCLFKSSPHSRRKFCSQSCYHLLYRGENTYQWKKDRTKLVKHDRRGDSAYREWRKQVWLRDNYKCKIANPDCKGRIEAHHILCWRDYPNLRYQVNNGITLCQAHHPRKRADEAKLSPYFQKLVAEKK